MGKRAAIFTEAEIRRAIRAAKAEGFDHVEIVDPKTGARIVCEKTAGGKRQGPAEILE
jgi:hypothetical protein